ncbi:SRPBCC family protein [Conexibacter sp. JD483]|uniref:type II toxin-antitoxin system RatA family toxin n=1 Tax=unclassified Conexibacter TaxID=2627773 RepID=UPI00272225F9|nr:MULTISPECIES: SRPBCC family protein [unclassified Conexibacter]MDO8184729.1 SRPBCC family protein [Conexibacter sp. CPCC 205706]MDO8196504.1 SRPBCC family protein [Conexibacter sp. CPCC 205762]MDR9368990.1 SRPBCC family protein [Conexibacter sp. JD483]
MSLTGEHTVEVAAPRERCYEIAADLERAPEWQSSLVSVDVLERDGEGRPTLVETVSDAKMKTIRAVLRFSYAPPERIDTVQEKGELKALVGRWTFEAIGPDRTRATYALEVDPGRMLGMLLRGPAVDRVREVLIERAAEELKTRAEQG